MTTNKMGFFRIEVHVEVNLVAFRAEYGEPNLSPEEIKERIRQDLGHGLYAAPYADAITSLELG